MRLSKWVFLTLTLTLAAHAFADEKSTLDPLKTPWCLQLNTGLAKCNKGVKNVSVVIKGPDGTTTLTDCDEIRENQKSLCASSQNDGGGVCSSAYADYRDDVRTRKEKESAVGNCESPTYVRCRDYLNSEEIEHFDERSATADDTRREFLRACPYAASKDVTKLKDLETTVVARVTDLEDRLQELNKQMLEDTAEAMREQTAMQTEIKALDEAAREPLENLQVALAGINQASSQKVNELRDAIVDLTSKSKQAKNVKVNEAYVTYNTALSKIRSDCYQFGLKAAAAAADKLDKGQEAVNVALDAGNAGIIAHLRGVANKAFRQCQSSQTFAGPIDNLVKTYQTQMTQIDDQNEESMRQVANLRAAFQALPAQVAQQLQQTNREAYAKVKQFAEEGNAKKQEFQRAVALTQAKQAEQQKLQVKLVQQQQSEEKILRAARANLKVAEQAEASVRATYEQFEAAMSACEGYKLSKSDMHRACCPNGTPLNGEPSACPTAEEKRELRSRGSHTRGTLED